jgi:single-stranded-DNA-specific exonuclease
MRRLTKKDVYEILKGRFAEGFVKLGDLPQPHTLKDMERAAKRIAEAIKRGEKIAVVGDYDVDGVVSTAIMKEFFDALNYPVQIKIPNRFKDGYGLSVGVIEQLDAQLIITVDNGITAHEAAQFCRQKGIDLIVTDHHTPPKELPKAYAIINPKQEACNFAYSEICGAQVAWFLVAQLKKELGLALDMKKFLDLLAIAIIADVMPLQHINRSLVQAGLKIFERSERPAIKFLRNSLKKSSFKSDDLAFGVAPVINSAGRMEDAKIALDFLLSKDFFEASIYYSRLLALNAQRKAEERRVFEESLSFVKESEPVIVSVGRDWNEGVVGIVASRLAEKFGKPSIVLTKSEKGHLKGSARSVGEVDLYALLDASKEHLLGFGGHKKAAGLMVEEAQLEKFRQKINAVASTLPKEQFLQTSGVLGELPLSEVDWELIDILEAFAPYGESNPMPKFAALDVEVLEWRKVGEKGEHLLLTLRQNGAVFKAIRFRNDVEIKTDRIDIVYYPAKNEFNNSVNIQLFVSKIS